MEIVVEVPSVVKSVVEVPASTLNLTAVISEINGIHNTAEDLTDQILDVSSRLVSLASDLQQVVDGLPVTQAAVA